MSVYFSKVIKTGERQREFNFRALPNDLGVRYSVDVPDDKGRRVVFSMYKNAEGTWRTAAGPLPIWIHSAENALSEAIEENLSLMDHPAKFSLLKTVNDKVKKTFQSDKEGSK